MVYPYSDSHIYTQAYFIFLDLNNRHGLIPYDINFNAGIFEGHAFQQKIISLIILVLCNYISVYIG